MQLAACGTVAPAPRRRSTHGDALSVGGTVLAPWGPNRLIVRS